MPDKYRDIFLSEIRSHLPKKIGSQLISCCQFSISSEKATVEAGTFTCTCCVNKFANGHFAGKTFVRRQEFLGWFITHKYKV